jgi:hypothetical protein
LPSTIACLSALELLASKASKAVLVGGRIVMLEFPVPRVAANLDTLRSASAKELRSGFNCSNDVRYCVCAEANDVRSSMVYMGSYMFAFQRDNVDWWCIILWACCW